MLVTEERLTVAEAIQLSTDAVRESGGRWWQGMIVLSGLQSEHIELCDCPDAYAAFWQWVANQACREFRNAEQLERFCYASSTLAAHPSMSWSTTPRVKSTLVGQGTTVLMPYLAGRIVDRFMDCTWKIA